jgi:hypothetical protein
MKVVAIVLVVLAVIMGFLFRPVCEPIDPEEVRTMNPPIHHRGDKTLWYKQYRTCEQRWCECKPWVERATGF